ncbi:hypothetical protein ACJX0J_009911 [Zea mays]
MSHRLPCSERIAIGVALVLLTRSFLAWKELQEFIETSYLNASRYFPSKAFMSYEHFFTSILPQTSRCHGLDLNIHRLILIIFTMIKGPPLADLGLPLCHSQMVGKGLDFLVFFFLLCGLDNNIWFMYSRPIHLFIHNIASWFYSSKSDRSIAGILWIIVFLLFWSYTFYLLNILGCHISNNLLHNARHQSS